MICIWLFGACFEARLGLVVLMHPISDGALLWRNRATLKKLWC